LHNPNESHVHGLYLASGVSKRFLSNKLTHRIHGQLLIEIALKKILESDLSTISVVATHENLSGFSVEHPKLRILENLIPENGMSYSMKIGLRSLPKNAIGAMILLADQPFITEQIVNMLIKKFLESKGAIVAPVIENQICQPVIFPKRLFLELSHVQGDIGGKDILKKDHKCVLVNLTGLYDPSDIDYASDFENLKSRF
jgi:molybdenum cofactor cytidylyltransferase